MDGYDATTNRSTCQTHSRPTNLHASCSSLTRSWQRCLLDGLEVLKTTLETMPMQPTALVARPSRTHSPIRLRPPAEIATIFVGARSNRSTSTQHVGFTSAFDKFVLVEQNCVTLLIV